MVGQDGKGRDKTRRQDGLHETRRDEKGRDKNVIWGP